MNPYGFTYSGYISVPGNILTPFFQLFVSSTLLSSSLTSLRETSTFFLGLVF